MLPTTLPELEKAWLSHHAGGLRLAKGLGWAWTGILATSLLGTVVSVFSYPHPIPTTLTREVWLCLASLAGVLLGGALLVLADHQEFGPLVPGSAPNSLPGKSWLASRWPKRSLPRFAPWRKRKPRDSIRSGAWKSPRLHPASNRFQL